MDYKPGYLPLTEEGQGLKWLFLDLNSYFASVEQQVNPRLRGRPVAVVPVMNDSTCAIAASYEARAQGVKTGTKIYEARRRCPDLICVPAQHALYVRYHHIIIAAISRHIPINKIWSIDELSSRLPPARREEGAVRDIALKVKRQIWQEAGEVINCSIGVAPNPFLAKVASNFCKPDGLTLLHAADLPAILFDLDLIDLPGINVRMRARLGRCGISTIRDLWQIPPRQARAVWGSVQGERLWYNLHGYDIAPPPKGYYMIGHSRVLAPEMRSSSQARLIARLLTRKACARLRQREYYAAGFRLGVRLCSGKKWLQEIKTMPAQDDFTFLRALEFLWSSMLAANGPGRMKKVSVTLHRLSRREEVTGDLFAQGNGAAALGLSNQTGLDRDRSERARPAVTGPMMIPPGSAGERSAPQRGSCCNLENQQALSHAMDTLARRFGSGAVSVGETPGQGYARTGRKQGAGIENSLSGGLDYGGTKIAFSRIPAPEEFD